MSWHSKGTGEQTPRIFMNTWFHKPDHQTERVINGPMRMLRHTAAIINLLLACSLITLWTGVNASRLNRGAAHMDHA